MLAELHHPEPILEDTWQRLSAAVMDPHHAFRNFVFASVGLGGAPEARTVVLRDVHRDERELLIHTDLRSPKSAAITYDGRSSCLFYDSKDRVQVRIQANAVLHTDDAIADEQWDRLPKQNRAIYAVPEAPGAILPAMNTQSPQAAGDGRPHFAVVRCTIESIDWLYLHSGGHRRIRFHWPAGVLTSEWLAP